MLFIFLILVALIARHLTALLQFGLWVWGGIRTVLKWISYVITVIMNFLMSPTKGTVKSWRVIIWFILNILILIVFQYTLVGWHLFWASFALMVFHLLIIISKMIMIGEDNLIMEGMLHKEKAIFRHLQGAIPFAVLVIAAIMFFLSLTASVFVLDNMLPEVVFYSHDEVNPLYWLVMMILQIPFIKQIVEFFEFINLDNMALRLTSTYGAALGVGIKLTVGMIVYSAIMLQLKQIKQIKSLIKAFESDESDIQYIQQRASRFPSIVKKELIDLSLNHPNSKVRRRAISVVSHAQIVSFPQAFISHLHKEKQGDLKEWGLKQILKILSDPEIVLDNKRRNLIKSHLNFQKKPRRKHSDAVIKLMRDIAEKISSKN